MPAMALCSVHGARARGAGMKRKRGRMEGGVEGSALSDEKKSFEAPQKNDSPLLAQSGDGKRRRCAMMLMDGCSKTD